ncbi:hypothetical protein M427DRAFT_385125 [Gonapodya prolifera JEL478]|uniref:Uncharacterized protein n=1 Tax=Gonapodya prolifera (strain JEL478) TaxID=1344416 RepID=A0A139A8K6_GONPJ|nr:hypothetical protein M427DRAFT_385125 [Gonapodya prolifera JEL478]|eukprot:KXS13067.1 hypothetical protein M427DRAFT_385125 [Gonapodya prolifera JEL478]
MRTQCIRFETRPNMERPRHHAFPLPNLTTLHIRIADSDNSQDCSLEVVDPLLEWIASLMNIVTIQLGFRLQLHEGKIAENRVLEIARRLLIRLTTPGSFHVVLEEVECVGYGLWHTQLDRAGTGSKGTSTTISGFTSRL